MRSDKKPSEAYAQTRQTCREISATLNEMKKTLAEMKACTYNKNNAIRSVYREKN